MDISTHSNLFSKRKIMLFTLFFSSHTHIQKFEKFEWILKLQECYRTHHALLTKLKRKCRKKSPSNDSIQHHHHNHNHNLHEYDKVTKCWIKLKIWKSYLKINAIDTYSILSYRSYLMHLWYARYPKPNRFKRKHMKIWEKYRITAKEQESLGKINWNRICVWNWRGTNETVSEIEMERENARER